MSALSARKARVAHHLASVADNPRTPRPELLKALSGLCKLGDAQRANHLLFKFFRPAAAAAASQPFLKNSSNYIKDLACIVFSSIVEASRSFMSLHGYPSPHTHQLIRWVREEMEDFSVAFSEYVKVDQSVVLALEAAKCALSYCYLLKPLHVIVSEQDLLDLITLSPRGPDHQDVVEDVYPLSDLRINNSVLQLLAQLFREYMHSIVELIAKKQNEDHQYMWQLSILINCTTLLSLFPIIAHRMFKRDQPSVATDFFTPGERELVDSLILLIKEAAGKVWTCFCQQFIRDTMSCLQISGQEMASSPQGMMPSFPFQRSGPVRINTKSVQNVVDAQEEAEETDQDLVESFQQGQMDAPDEREACDGGKSSDEFISIEEEEESMLSEEELKLGLGISREATLDEYSEIEEERTISNHCEAADDAGGDDDDSGSGENPTASLHAIEVKEDSITDDHGDNSCELVLQDKNQIQEMVGGGRGSSESRRRRQASSRRKREPASNRPRWQ
ncbi:hypothetical protein PR202_ga21852 [Eleusine coracana subsp. coracana]|uniref:Uncharacterized protein n=1 Tax=Eleusine coracana subsp. coracana TaxID=191504 RepID=A0AAV5D208_ELECO|nr:hypothetical protein PR202_ga21852 [Eleusine coracana subsp. coracana]